MNDNLPVLPLFIHLLAGIILVLLNRRTLLVRLTSALFAAASVLISLLLVRAVHERGIMTLDMSGWTAPLGITFTVDMLAALLVLAASIIGLASVLYSWATLDRAREQHYYYALLHFLLVGVTGSFLTGDIFNLFVCFEVMLISSYALIVIGGEKAQLREAIKYILLNVISSTMFVVTIAYLYAAVGTLNMAHLSERVAEAGQAGILTVIAALLLIVFGLKAGLFLFYWLPGSYSVPPPAIIAIFAGLLTKVGVYAIVRVLTLIFYHDPPITHGVLAWMSGATMALGALGAITYRDVNRIMIYNIIISVGLIGFAQSTGNAAGQYGVIYYLLHDMLAKTLLFLLGGLIIAAAGTGRLAKMGGLMREVPLLGWMFLVTVLAIVGVPPLSGFVGKLLIIRGGLEAKQYLLTGLGLLSSLMAFLSMLKIFMRAFWGAETDAERPSLSGHGPVSFRVALLPSAALLLLLIGFGLGAEWLYPYIEQASQALMDPRVYIDAVLKE